MSLQAPSNPYVKDAEACGRFFVDLWKKRDKPKYRHLLTDDHAYSLGRWAGHWGLKAQALNDELEAVLR